MKATARVLHAAVALAATVGFLLELVRAITDGPGIAPTHAERIVRLFSYFTIQSNLLVAVASWLLAWRPDRDGRVFRVVRLDALLCIAVTGVVFHTVLAEDAAQLTPSGNLAGFLLHTLSPAGAVVAWLLVGPRPRFDWRTVWWSVAYPLAWIAYTFVRGAAVGWYPYPFLDVATLGYGRALASTGAVAVLFLALAVVLGLVDRRLPAVLRAGAAPGVG
jgi:hypothetical protein